MGIATGIPQPMLAERDTPEFDDPRFLVHLPHLDVSLKVDGIRGINKDKLVISRSLTPIPSGFVQKHFALPEYEGFDGEMVVGEPNAIDVFAKTTSATRTIGSMVPMTWLVFDMWNMPGAPYRERMMRLKARLAMYPSEHIKVWNSMPISSVFELERLEAEALEAGWEGLMGRNRTKPYKWGRSTLTQGALLKVKRTKDLEARVEGFEEAYENTNEALKDARGLTKRTSHQEGMVGKGTLGALKVIGVNGRFKDKRFNIGVFRNLSAADKKEIWDNQEKYRDWYCRYVYQDVGVVDLPRILRWDAWRNKEDIDFSR